MTASKQMVCRGPEKQERGLAAKEAHLGDGNSISLRFTGGYATVYTFVKTQIAPVKLVNFTAFKLYFIRANF